MIFDASFSDFSQSFKATPNNPQVVVWEFHPEEYELLLKNITVTKDKVIFGEPVGNNYSLWKSKLLPIFEHNKSLNFQVNQGKRSALPQAEKDLVSLLRTVPIDWITSKDVECSRNSSTTGSWGLSKHYINWHRHPYYHLLILNCDENDYKKKLRSITKTWVQNRKREEDSFGVVYIHDGKIKKKVLKTSTVLDKIKIDVGKENFCSVDGEKIGIPSISELNNMVVEGITQKFLGTWKKFAHQLDSIENKWDLPGWNFATYFIIRDGFALLAEMFGLYAHAFKHYWDLEQIVFGTNNNYRDTQSLNDFRNSYEKYSEQRKLEFKIDPNLPRPPSHLIQKFESQFSKIFPIDNLRIEPALNIFPEETRKEINIIALSRFEVYNYIFSRISAILLKCFFTDLCAKKALHYFSDMPSKLLTSDSKAAISTKLDLRVYESYVHTWAYANVSYILDICQHQGAFFIDSDMNTKSSYYFGDLFLLVRTHLEAIGTLNNMSLGWSEINEDDLDKPPLVIEKPTDHNNFITFESNLEIVTHLMKSLKDPFGFDQIYLELSGAASSAYARVDRKRLHLNARGSIAAIRFKQGKFEEATEILLKLIVQLRKDRWEDLAGFYLVKLAQAQLFCGFKKDLLETIFIILKNQTLSQKIHQHYSKKFFDLSNEISEILHVPGKQFKALFKQEKKTIKESFIGREELICEFTSFFHEPVKNVRAELFFKKIGDSKNPEEMICNVENFSFQNGKSLIPLNVFLKSSGEFILQKFRIFIGNISFDLETPQTFRIKVKKSEQNIDLVFKTPNCLIIGHKQWIQITSFSNYFIRNLSILFTTSKPLSICNDRNIYIQFGKLNKENWKKSTLNSNYEWISNEEISKGIEFHILLPVFCSKESSIQCIVEKLKLEYKFEKDTGEFVTTTSGYDLTFYDPLMHFYSEHQISENKIMFQTAVECTNQNPIRILEEKFTCEVNGVNVKELNKNKNVRNQILNPESIISYVFEVEFLEQIDPGSIGSFYFNYHVLDENGNPDYLEYIPEEEKENFTYTINYIQCNIPSPYLFRIIANVEEEIIMSQSFTFSFTIEPSITENLPYEYLIYEVSPRESNFMIIGEKKKRLPTLKDTVSCKCILFPISSGQLSLPKVKISLVKKIGDDPISLPNSRIQLKFPNGRSIFVKSSQDDSLGSFWKVDGNIRTSLATEATASHISQLSLRNPIINFSEYDSDSSPHRIIDETYLFKQDTPIRSNDSNSHKRSKSDISADESFQTISLA